MVRKRLPVKVLGRGDMGHALTIQANAFSRTAKEKIEQAGGQAQTL
ncbi:MAG TPA: uL15m family ribosomal protein [Candidatus Methylomirabilis sp.]